MGFFLMLKADASDSKALYKMGVKTNLADTAEKFYNSPVEAMFESLSALSKNASEMIERSFTGFLIANKSLIKRAFFFRRQTRLLYYIVLKKDNIENRQVLFDFLDDYENVDNFYNHVPVEFHFIPKDIQSDFTSTQELNL